MIITFLDNKYNHNITKKDITWNDFLKIIESAPESKEKGVGAIIGGNCVWEDIIFESKFGGKIPTAKNRKCINRQLIILDADYPTVDNNNLENDLIYRAFSYFYDLNAAFAYYSTFSASSDSPRYRLCTYLNRPVTSDEYKIITQAIVFFVSFG